jgi:hypothetical protein
MAMYAKTGSPELNPAAVVALLFALKVLLLYRINKDGHLARWLARLREMVGMPGPGTPDPVESIDSAIACAGYAYDGKQDIFYSRMDAWQRNFGYFRLYDEAAAPLHMIIDCEPIHFSYGGMRWMIEFWKGQYGMTTGGELGVYHTERPDLQIPGIYSGPFFECAHDENMLEMSFVMKKDGEAVFSRQDRHWWLTGFVLGMFSHPHELSMDIAVTLKDRVMRNAFIGGLLEAGYREDELTLTKNTVSLHFAQPRTPQPTTRTPYTDRIIQMKNKLLCEQYQSLTVDIENVADKVGAIREKQPDLYQPLLKIGKTAKLFESFHSIKGYL